MPETTQTPAEMMVAEEAKINAENAAAEQAAQATPAEKEAALQEEKNLQELDKDEEFHKTVPKNFNQNKDWRKLYYQRKEAERKAKELEEQLATLSTQKEEETPPEITEEQIQAFAKEKGYTLTKAQAEKMADDFEELYAKATPEEKEWWGKHDKAVFNKFAKDLSPFMNSMTEMYIDHTLDKSEKQAREYIKSVNEKHKLSIDFDKDIEPEVTKLIKSRQFTREDIIQGHINIFTLTKELMAEKGIELGKKLSLKEQAQLNENKKKANMETSENLAQKGQDDFAGKSPSEIMAELYKREGF